MTTQQNVTNSDDGWTLSNSGKNKTQPVHLLPKDYSLNNLSVQHLHQCDDAPENILHVFIPRILTNVSRNRIVHAFDEQKIGKVFYIDAKFKVNQNNNAYGFAFVSIKLYDNEQVRALQTELYETGVVRLMYDEPLYWEMKQYVPREKRASTVVVSAIKSIESSSSENISVPISVPMLTVPMLTVPEPTIVDITTIESAFRSTRIRPAFAPSLTLPSLKQSARSEALERDVIADRKQARTPSPANIDFISLMSDMPTLRADALEFRSNSPSVIVAYSETPSTNVCGVKSLIGSLQSSGLPDWSFDCDILNIQTICAELSNKHTCFTKEDSYEIEKEYSLFSREIYNQHLTA